MLVGCQTSEKVYLPDVPKYLDKHQLLNHFQYLSSDQLQGRKFNTQANIEAQNYLIKQLKSLDVFPFKGAYRHSFNVRRYNQNLTAHNIVGMVPASNLSDSYIVLTAHYDHLGIKSGHIYNGADDNASGVSALLVIAQALKKKTLKNNIIILFTDAEEQGLKGAKAFINQNKSIIKNVKLNVNLDMLAGESSSRSLYYLPSKLGNILKEKELELFYQEHNNYQLKVVKSFRRLNKKITTKVNWLKASDHFAFHQYKIPFIYYGVGVHGNYHTPNDKYLNTNHQLFLNTSNLIFEKIIYLDKHI